MVPALINLVITLLIVGVVWWAVTAIIALIPLPAPIGQVINIILILILCLIVINALLGFVPGSAYGVRLFR